MLQVYDQLTVNTCSSLSTVEASGCSHCVRAKAGSRIQLFMDQRCCKFHSELSLPVLLTGPSSQPSNLDRLEILPIAVPPDIHKAQIHHISTCLLSIDKVTHLRVYDDFVAELSNVRFIGGADVMMSDFVSLWIGQDAVLFRAWKFGVLGNEICSLRRYELLSNRVKFGQ
jgi:hypothetical protein